MKTVILCTIFVVLCATNVRAQETTISFIPPEPAKADFSLLVKEGRVTLSCQDADIRTIITTIQHQSGIPIEISEKVTGTLNADFSGLTIEEALRRITGNFAITYSDKTPEKIGKIFVLSAANEEGAQQHTTTKNHPGPSPPSLPPRRDKQIESRIVANELVVRFKPSVSEEEVARLNQKLGVTIKTRIAQLNAYVLTLPQHTTTTEAMSLFRKEQLVDKAEPNHLINIQSLPNDPGFPQQWGLHNSGQLNGLVDADIDAPEAWVTTSSNQDIIIAIVDTGVDYLHEDLIDAIWHNPGEIPGNGLDDDGNGFIDDEIGWDFVEVGVGHPDEDLSVPDNNPMDNQGHGTHVAGIAGATAGNGVGITGVSPNCRIMPVRAGYKTASGDGSLTSVDAAQAIVYAIENGAQIVNLSWGDSQESFLITDAISLADQCGILVITAAGNNGSSTPLFPAALVRNNLISVGASDEHDQRASFSNYGSWVDVSAPGASIYSTGLNNTYLYQSGSSMATPVVSGIAASVFSLFPGITANQVKARILRSADSVPDLADANRSSARVNFFSTLNENFSSPYIFSISPTTIHRNEQVTIRGDQFGTAQGNSTVTLGELICPVTSWSDSEIICLAPENAVSDTLQITTDQGPSNITPLTILPTYYDETIIPHEFIGGGASQAWQADDQSWPLTLPFPFRFFGKTYDLVYINSNGYLDFSSGVSTYMNSVDTLTSRVMIAPLWDDLLTSGSGQTVEDIFISYPTTNSVCIRWQGEFYEDNSPVNMEVVLYDDGHIKFNYGAGNRGLSPTVAVSGGTPQKFHLSSKDGTSLFNETDTILFTPRLHSMEIPLTLGWNLISLPIKPDNQQVSNVLADAETNIQSVWGYQGGTWQVWLPGQPELSDFNTIKPGNGYWIKTEQSDQVLRVTGLPADLSSQVLENGWNLIGFSSLALQDPCEATKYMNQTVTNIWGYNGASWQNYNFTNPNFSDLKTIEPGKGYWVDLLFPGAP